MINQSTLLIKQFVGLIKLGAFPNTLEFVEELGQKVILDLNLTVVNKMSHIFSPAGITMGYILSQSHLIIHTYPENGIIHVDLVMCSDHNETEFKDSLTQALSKYDVHSIEIKSVVP